MGGVNFARVPAATLCETDTVLSFFFDYASPFAYLASTQVRRVAEDAGAPLDYRPFLLGGLFRDIGTPLVPIAEMSEAKRGYVRIDMQRWATHWNVPLRFPTAFPLRTVLALRVTLLALDEAPELAPAFVDRVMKLCWADDQAPDEEHLAMCLNDVGLPAAMLDRAGEKRAALIEATAHAKERGVFGTPTFFVGDELFFGQDRIDFVAEALGTQP